MKPLSLSILLFLLTLPSLALAGTYEEADQAYEDGDYEKAKEILIPLAENGHAKAMNLLGLMHSKGKGYPRCRTKACNWYEKAANAGYASGQGNLALCYMEGDGRDKDEEKGLFWHKKAALNGRERSQISLFTYYSDKNNRSEAQKWISMAMASGSTSARVGGWVLGHQNTGAPISVKEVACFYAMNVILQKPWDYCD
ncbi:MAG: tetratricopeptide repeat protein [Rhodospirillaceae bacterium]